MVLHLSVQDLMACWHGVVFITPSDRNCSYAIRTHAGHTVKMCEMMAVPWDRSYPILRVASILCHIVSCPIYTYAAGRRKHAPPHEEA